MASQTHLAITGATHLLCPLCLASQTSNDNAHLLPRLRASEDQRSLVCDQKHTFDIAKQGYVNLLPVQQKKSLSPGDSKEMVLARKRFLSLGYYQPLVDSLIQCCQQQLCRLEESRLEERNPHHTAPVILDAGCGEGYYSNQLHLALSNQYPDLTSYRFDISKHAVIEAAKSNKSVCSFVSTIKFIPIKPQSCDIIISVFSPMQASQFQHLLKTDGKLLVLCAGKNHLHQLKSLLYDNTSDYDEDKFLGQLDKHFTLSERSSIQQTMQLNSHQDITSLLAMTPHYWRASPEAKQQLNNIEQFDVDIDVQLLQFIPRDTTKQGIPNR